LFQLDRRCLTKGTLAQFVNDIRTSAFRNVWGMLDGTCRPICRPTRAQHVYYSGMTSSHCIKFLCITLPNGILCYANGPHAGIRHDARIFREHLKPLLEQDSHYLLNGQPLVLLADSGFPKNPHLLKRTTLPLSHAEQQFNILHS